MGGDGHDVVFDTGDFAKQGTDVLCSLGDLDVEQLLDGQREALLVGHHRDVVQTVKVGQGLQVGAVLDELLGAAVQQADVGVGTHNLLSVELQNQAQHAVGSGMLGAEVDGVVSDLPALGGAAVVGGRVHGAGALGVDGVGEVGIGLDETGALLVLHVGIVAWARGGQAAGNGLESRGALEGGSGCLAQALGGVAGVARNGDGHCG